jgi:hypothetical protein
MDVKKSKTKSPRLFNVQRNEDDSVFKIAYIKQLFTGSEPIRYE